MGLHQSQPLYLQQECRLQLVLAHTFAIHCLLYRCIYPIIIDREGLSLNKLAKSFAIIKEFAAEKQLEYGNGCQITFVGGSQRLAQDLYQIDAALLQNEIYIEHTAVGKLYMKNKGSVTTNG